MLGQSWPTWIKYLAKVLRVNVMPNCNWLFVIPVIMVILASLACNLEVNFTNLSLESPSAKFEVDRDIQYNWQIDLKPDTKYEVHLSLLDPVLDQSRLKNGNLAGLWVENAHSCSDCVTAANVTSGNLNSNGLKITFVAPSNGKVRIVFYWLGYDDIKCEIHIKEVT